MKNNKNYILTDNDINDVNTLMLLDPWDGRKASTKENWTTSKTDKVDPRGKGNFLF